MAAKLVFSNVFNSTLANHSKLSEKLKDFLRLKTENPMAQFGASDTSFVSSKSLNFLS